MSTAKNDGLAANMHGFRTEPPNPSPKAPRRSGRGPYGDDERAIDRVPAYADGREKTDENYHQFAERITKARKKEAPPWQKPCPPYTESRSRPVWS